MFRFSPLQGRILAIALPMIAGSISVPLLGVVDTAILGHLDSARYLGAVVAGNSAITLVLWLFAFLRMGITGMAARAAGAGDHQRVLLVLAQSLVLAGVIGCLLIALQAPIFHLILSRIRPPAELLPLSQSYCAIRILGAPATLATFSIIGWLLALQRARAVLLLLVVTSGCNMLLDWLLVVGLDLFSDGAAIASVIAEYTGLALAAALARLGSGRLLSRFEWRQLLQPRAYRPLLSTNRHLLIRTACLILVLTFFTAQGARQGETILAANGILLQLLFLIAYGLDGFANAAETLAGRAAGASDWTSFRRIAVIVNTWGLAIATVITALLVSARQPIIALFTDLPAVQVAAALYFPWLASLPVITTWCFMFDGLLLGAGRTRAMQNTMLLAALGVFLPLWAATRDWGNNGLWLAFVVFMATRSAAMATAFWLTLRSVNVAKKVELQAQ